MEKRVSNEGMIVSDVDPYNDFRSAKISDLCGALAKAQAEFKTACRTKENKYFKSQYEDLVAIVDASRPALTKNGLSVIQQIKQKEDGASMLHTILMHSSGQWVETRTRISPPKQDIQTLMSYTNCIKRLAYASLVGVVAANEDDDGFVADIHYRESFTKGLESKFKPGDQKYEVVSRERREELEYELSDPVMEDYLDEILNYFKIQSLADLPADQYNYTRKRLMDIKIARKKGV